MKYVNSLIFLSLMLLVAGCQKKEQPAPVKKAHHTSAKDAKAMKEMPGKKDAKAMHQKDKPAPKKTGPTMLETKKAKAPADKGKAAHMKMADKKSSFVKASDFAKASTDRSADKKAMPNKAKKDSVKA